MLMVVIKKGNENPAMPPVSSAIRQIYMRPRPCLLLHLGQPRYTFTICKAVSCELQQRQSLCGIPSLKCGGSDANSKIVVWTRYDGRVFPTPKTFGNTPRRGIKSRNRWTARCSKRFVGDDYSTDSIILSEGIKILWVSYDLWISRAPLCLSHSVSALTLNLPATRATRESGAKLARVGPSSTNDPKYALPPLLHSRRIVNDGLTWPTESITGRRLRFHTGPCR